MASHQVAIAKAAFAAGLLRADPTSVSREDIDQFHSLLDKVLLQCSPSNIQNCKAWLLRHTVPSPARIAVLGKYLTALVRSFKKTEVKTGNEARRTDRRGLHVLYLLHDLLAQTKHDDEPNNNGPSAYLSLTSGLQPHLSDLVQAAVALESPQSRINRKFHERIDALLDMWKKVSRFPREYVDKAREAAEEARKANVSETGKHEAQAEEVIKPLSELKDAPYVMPATHGDPSTPYYDLPAGNMMPLIAPNSRRPINTYKIKPLEFTPGPAPDALVAAVKKLLSDVERVFDVTHNKERDIFVDRDEMGQLMIRDESSGETVPAETYYGWSREFCEKMKKRKKEGPPKDMPSPKGIPARGLSRSRSRSRSKDRGRSRDRSPNPWERKRGSSEFSMKGQGRRMSFQSWSRSESESDRRSGSERGRGRGRGRPRKRGRGRSGHRNQSPRQGQPRRSRSPYHSSSVSRSRSPPRKYRSLRSTSPRGYGSGYGSHPHSRASTPREFGPPPSRTPPNHMQPFFTASDPHPPFAPTLVPPPPPPGQFNTGFPMGPGLGPGGMPIPPPPPPNYKGPWPPPPPPHLMGGMNAPQQTPPFPPAYPPFPPLPPMQNQGRNPQMLMAGHALPTVPLGGWGQPQPPQRRSQHESDNSYGYGRGGRGRGW